MDEQRLKKARRNPAPSEANTNGVAQIVENSISQLLSWSKSSIFLKAPPASKASGLDILDNTLKLSKPHRNDQKSIEPISSTLSKYDAKISTSKSSASFSHTFKSIKTSMSKSLNGRTNGPSSLKNTSYQVVEENLSSVVTPKPSKLAQKSSTAPPSRSANDEAKSQAVTKNNSSLLLKFKKTDVNDTSVPVYMHNQNAKYNIKKSIHSSCHKSRNKNKNWSRGNGDDYDPPISELRPSSRSPIEVNWVFLGNKNQEVKSESEMEIKDELVVHSALDEPFEECVKFISDFNKTIHTSKRKKKRKRTTTIPKCQPIDFDYLDPDDVQAKAVKENDSILSSIINNIGPTPVEGTIIDYSGVALLDQRTMIDYLVKEENYNSGIDSQAESQTSSSRNPKIRISTNIFETGSSQLSCTDIDSDEFDIQMDPFEDDKTGENDSWDNEDDLEYSLSLQRYLQSTEPSLNRAERSSARPAPKEQPKLTESRDVGTNSFGFGVFTESSGSSEDEDVTLHESELSSSSSENEDSDDESSSIYSFEKDSSSGRMLHSKTSSVIKPKFLETCGNITKSTKKTDENVKLSNPNLLDSEMKDANAEGFDQTYNDSLNSNTISFSRELQPLKTGSDSESDSCDLINLSERDYEVRPKKTNKMPPCIPKYRIVPIKIEDAIPRNRKTGAVKIRFHPTKARSYAYRKRQWSCPMCYDTMKYGSRFMHLQLKHEKPYLCPHCPYKSKTRNRLRKHIWDHKDSNKFKCKDCSGVSFCFQETLDRHRKTVHAKGIFVVKCIICDDVFRSTIELGRHHRTKHPGDTPYQCQQCEKAYTASGALKLHILSRHQKEKPYVCDKCGFGFTRKDKMEIHRNRHFKRKNNVTEKSTICNLKCPHIKPALQGTSELHICKLCGHVCEFCSYIFQSNRLFNAHTHKNFCAICVIKFANEKAYKFHVAYHEPEHIICHRCEICKFGFTNIRSLNIHAIKIHQMKLIDYNCPTCGKTFTAPHLLAAHEAQVHSKNKNCHKCPWCPNAYISVTLLHFHLHRRHTLERHYRCDTCSKGFVRKGDLNRHVKTHTDDSNEQLFQCNICDLKLKSKRNLMLHMRIHEERKLFLCDACGVSFKQKCYLKLHKTMHEEGGKLYPCGYCDQSYLKRDGLANHLVRLHGFKSTNIYSCEKCHKRFKTKQGQHKHCTNASCGKRMGKSKKGKIGNFVALDDSDVSEDGSETEKGK